MGSGSGGGGCSRKQLSLMEEGMAGTGERVGGTEIE